MYLLEITRPDDFSKNDLLELIKLQTISIKSDLMRKMKFLGDKFSFFEKQYKISFLNKKGEQSANFFKFN